MASVAFMSAGSLMFSALLKLRMCGSVASPTPTVPISSDSIELDRNRQALELVGERRRGHPSGGASAQDAYSLDLHAQVSASAACAMASSSRECSSAVVFAEKISGALSSPGNEAFSPLPIWMTMTVCRTFGGVQRSSHLRRRSSATETTGARCRRQSLHPRCPAGWRIARAARSGAAPARSTDEAAATAGSSDRPLTHERDLLRLGARSPQTIPGLTSAVNSAARSNANCATCSRDMPLVPVYDHVYRPFSAGAVSQPELLSLVAASYTGARACVAAVRRPDNTTATAAIPMIRFMFDSSVRAHSGMKKGGDKVSALPARPDAIQLRTDTAHPRPYGGH